MNPVEAVRQVLKAFRDLVSRKPNAHELEELDKRAEQSLVALEAYLATLQAQNQALERDSKSEDWLTRNWRPIVMLCFTFMVVVSWVGWGPPVPDWATEMIQWGMLGYIGARSVEKLGVPLLNQLFTRSQQK